MLGGKSFSVGLPVLICFGAKPRSVLLPKALVEQGKEVWGVTLAPAKMRSTFSSLGALRCHALHADARVSFTFRLRQVVSDINTKRGGGGGGRLPNHSNPSNHLIYPSNTASTPAALHNWLPPFTTGSRLLATESADSIDSIKTND